MSDSREWTAARDEYTYQLVQEIAPRILEIFEEIYNKCKEEAGEEKEEYTLVLFQLALQKIPHWNNISVEKVCKNIITGYPSLMDHVAAVFVSNIQILSCVRLDADNKKDVHIKIPSRDSFIHKTIIQCADNIFQDPMVFWHKIPVGERGDNRKKKKELISESIQEAIRDMLPIQEILKEYLSETGTGKQSTPVSSSKDKKSDADETGSVASEESKDPESDSDSGPEDSGAPNWGSSDDDEENAPRKVHFGGDVPNNANAFASQPPNVYNQTSNIPPPVPQSSYPQEQQQSSFFGQQQQQQQQQQPPQQQQSVMSQENQMTEKWQGGDSDSE
tara:strand:- start:2024 stop:3019 length:996 start_codon:yes stop_codon:yes gene_type:complete